MRLHCSFWGTGPISCTIFFTAHVISEIVTQTDVRIKKQYGPVFFFWLYGHIRLWPKTRKNTGPYPQNMVQIVYTGKNVRSVLLFRWVRTHFFCCVNGLRVKMALLVGAFLALLCNCNQQDLNENRSTGFSQNSSSDRGRYKPRG